MKGIFHAAAVMTFCAASAFASQTPITLDLTKAVSPLTFNATDGSWTGTYDDKEEVIESQCFIFLHNSMGAYKTWWGFTASISTDNAKQSDFFSHQWSNMAKGGIVIQPDGTVAKDAWGAPLVSDTVPYLVAFGSGVWGKKSIDMIFNDGLEHEPIGVYLNLTSYPYYAVEEGDALCRPFNNGDTLTITVHGVAANESERCVSVKMASCTNGDLTINRRWKYVDLSSLGKVEELYFSIESSDCGSYGINTPTYFALSALSVKNETSGTATPSNFTDVRISYDRSSRMVSIDGEEYSAVYDCNGRKVMESETPHFSISSLESGVYIIRSGKSRLKIYR